MSKRLFLFALTLLASCETLSAQYPSWQHSGSLVVVTSPDGANLPVSAVLENFPLLVHLDKDWFDFQQAQAAGEDIRFSVGGQPLNYEIEEWDAVTGRSAVWVRVPLIKGNQQQEITLHWGKAHAVSESSGKGVFNESNGYSGVFHLNDSVKDSVGVLEANDHGTTPSPGVIGKGRRFSNGYGINCGEAITTFPRNDCPHSTELWFRCRHPSDRIFCWGSDGPRTMVQIMSGKPPHVVVDCYGPASVRGKRSFAMDQWVHVTHTFQNGQSRVYFNGHLDGEVTSKETAYEIKSPVQMYMGGWKAYGFRGDMDEVRVSNVARSADWVRLQYENQKPLQTVTGPLVQPAGELRVSENRVTLLEGQSTTLTAKAGGVRKIYWTIKRGNEETVVATDRFHFLLDAGRVSGDQTLTIQLKAVYAGEAKTVEIPVTIREGISDPVYTLQAPAEWDGRTTIEVVPQITNLAAMQAKGAGEVTYQWKAAGMAVIQEVTAGKLTLKRAHNSGNLKVTAVARNGGQAVTQSVEIVVKEPTHDPWAERTPGQDEKPVDHQFYARDDTNEGTLYYNGTLAEAAETVFLKLYADDMLIKTESQKLPLDRTYAFAFRLKAGLIVYKVELGTKSGDAEVVLNTVSDLVCGDAYIVDGQSNAVAYNYENDTQHPEITKYTSTWIRSFGGNGEANDPLGGGFGNGVIERLTPTSPDRVHFIGAWPMAMARKLVAEQKLPICIFNGAVGGTRIDQHMPDPTDRLNTTNTAHSIYRNLLKRISAAGMTHGIRGVLWHQGEADQGYDGPDNCYGCQTHQQYWIDLTAAWKHDYPNIRHFFLFQIWPNACSQGGNRHSDKLRDVQRQLSRLYSNLSVVPTLHLPSGGCHFLQGDYEKMGHAMALLVQRDDHGQKSARSVSAPDLLKALYTSVQQDCIRLEFDQPVEWTESLASQFHLDSVAGHIRSGVSSGNILTLKLTSASDAKTVTYLVDKTWDHKTLLYGSNGIAALTFCEVLIEPQ